MPPSITLTEVATPPAEGRARWAAGLERITRDPTLIGVAFVLVALGIYLFSNPSRWNIYNHFVLQAEAFLRGEFAIPMPRFQDVMPLPDRPGYGIIPFPPLPALLLVPLVLVQGVPADQGLFCVVLGALNVGLCWRLLTRVTESAFANFLGTVFFAFGTVHWYAAMLGSTWFYAHVAAITFLMLAITIALDAERQEQARELVRAAGGVVGRASRFIDPLQFLAGLVFGVAALARLTIIFGAPFFVFVGGGGSWFRRAFSAGLGALIPMLLLLGYNLAMTGQAFNPAYEWLYHHEYLGYMPPGLEIDTSLGIEDPRHIPVNLLIMFGWPPIYSPDCGLQLLNRDCALLMPDKIGMSLLLTSPAYLLVLPLVATAWRMRLVLGAALAVFFIALVNLMHFSQGWVQFGYRFSNDFAPFAVILVTLAIARLQVRWLAVALVALAVLINAWGVYWGVVLGW